MRWRAGWLIWSRGLFSGLALTAGRGEVNPGV